MSRVAPQRSSAYRRLGKPGCCQVRNRRSKSSHDCALHADSAEDFRAELYQTHAILVIPVGPVWAGVQFLELRNCQIEFRCYVLEILGDRCFVIRWYGDSGECCFARKLSCKNKARKMRSPLIVAEFSWQPIAFVKAGEARFIVLVRVSLPSKALHQQLHRVLLHVRYVVERFYNLHPLHIAIVQFECEDIGERKCLELARAELAVYILELTQIRRVIMPFKRLADTLCRVVRTRKDVLEPMARGKVVQPGEERMILWRVDMGNLRLEKGQLKVLHLAPVDHFGVQVEAQRVDQLLNVVDGLLGVPTRIDVE